LHVILKLNLKRDPVNQLVNALKRVVKLQNSNRHGLRNGGLELYLVHQNTLTTNSKKHKLATKSGPRYISVCWETSLSV